MAEVIEKPTVEEPKEKVVETKKEVDVDGLITELEQAGVNNTEQLQGKLAASQQAGRMAELLGDSRKEVAELNQLLQEANKPAKDVSFDEEYTMQQPADMEGLFNSVLDKREAKVRKANAEMQARQMEAWNTINTDEDYALVKEIWEDKLKDPKLVYQIQNGMVDPVREYSSVVRGYYKGMINQAATTITHLRGGTPEVKPPHVEAGDRTVQIPAGDEEVPDDVKDEVERLKQQKARVDKGAILTPEEETNAMLDLLSIQNKTQQP